MVIWFSEEVMPIHEWATYWKLGGMSRPALSLLSYVIEGLYSICLVGYVSECIAIEHTTYTATDGSHYLGQAKSGALIQMWYVLIFRHCIQSYRHTRYWLNGVFADWMMICILFALVRRYREAYAYATMLIKCGCLLIKWCFVSCSLLLADIVRHNAPIYWRRPGIGGCEVNSNIAHIKADSAWVSSHHEDYRKTRNQS